MSSLQPKRYLPFRNGLLGLLVLLAAPRAWAQEAVTAPAVPVTTVTTSTTVTTVTTTSVATFLAPLPVTPPTWTVSASCEAGFSLAEGNTSNRSLASGCRSSEEKELWRIAFDGNMRYGKNRFGGPRYTAGPRHPRGDFVLTENNFFAGLREDRFFSEAKAQYAFLGQSIAGNQFKGFWRRTGAQAGYGYAFLNEETVKLKAEVSAAYDRDRLVLPDADNNLNDDRIAGVAALSGEKVFNDIVAATGAANYNVNFEDTDDYRIRGELGLSAKLNGRVAFKSSGLVNYENKPKLVEPVDKAGAKVLGAPPAPAQTTDYSLVNLLVITIY